jgi:hypothetical protein
MNLNNSSISNFEKQNVRSFLRNGMLFSIPFLLYAIFITVTDPFNFIGVTSLIPDDVKRRTSYPLNPCFWKMENYLKHPTPNLLLGDSRMDAISTAQVKNLTGDDYFNFAYGGATMREILDTFWFAAKHQKLERVYIGLNLTLYNDYNITDRTKTYLTISENPALYFVNRTVLRSAVYATYSYVTATDLKLGVPSEDADTFWLHQLRDVNGGYFRNYVYPVHYRSELQQVAEHCKRNGIKLSFIIFPTHSDVHGLMTQYNLTESNLKFREDLRQLGVVYDFDFPNELTARRENFRDPDHTTGTVTESVTVQIWKGPLRDGRIL